MRSTTSLLVAAALALGTAAAAPSAQASTPATAGQDVVAVARITSAKKSNRVKKTKKNTRKPARTHLQLSVSGTPKAALVVTGRNTRRVASKSTVLTLRPGGYTVQAAKVTFQGSQYVPAKQTWKVSLRKGRTGLILVNYTRVAASSPGTSSKARTKGPDAPPSGELSTMVTLVNQARATTQQCGPTTMPPTHPLTYDAQLAVAAQRHAEDMSTQNYFEHDSLDGRTFVERIHATSYDGEPGGENIAMGYPTASQVVQGWLASPGHCRNIMNPEFDEVGLGLALHTDPRYELPVAYWVQDFGYAPAA